MSWIEAIPAIFLGMFIIWLPGAGVAWLLRFRGLSFLAVSAAASLALHGMAAIVLDLLGLSWNLFLSVSFALIINILCLLVRVIPGINNKIKSYGSWAGAYQYLGLGIAAFVLGLSFLIVSGRADAISQTYDVVFHYNLTQYIYDTGNASPFRMDMVWQSPQAFYPSLWSAVAALAMPVATAIEANNILVLLIISVVWPLSVTMMAQVILGDRRQYLMFAGILAAAFPAFPLLFADWGALYPSLMSYCLIPITFAAVVSITGLARSPLSPLTSWVVLLGATFATGVAQPSGIYAVIVLSIIPVVILAYRLWRKYGLFSVKGSLLFGLVITGMVSLGFLWAAGLNSNHWNIRITASQAAGDVLFNAVPGRLPGLTVSVLALIGAVVIWKQRKQRWLLFVYVLVASLYVFASALPFEAVRNILSGIWYADNRRIMAFLPMVVILMAILGASFLFSWVRDRAFSQVSRPKYIALFLVVLVTVSQLVGMNHARYSLWKEYVFDDTSDLITPDEQKVFDYVREYIHEDAVFVGHPWTGTSLVYPVTGHEVLFHHMTGGYSVDQAYIAQHLNDPDQRVCELLKDYGVTHALDFGAQLIFDDLTKEDVPDQINFFRGLDRLENSSILSEVYIAGEAKLFQVTGCKQ